MEEAAYAKLEGIDENSEPLKRYIKMERVVLGRNKKEPEADYIALGACKAVSRKHAVLSWDRAAKRWAVDVLGKNGMTVDGVEVHANGRASLKSVSALRLGSVQVYFSAALPAQPE